MEEISNEQQQIYETRKDVYNLLSNINSSTGLSDNQLSECANHIMSLIESHTKAAFKKGLAVGQYQAADKMYGSVTQMWLFKDDVSPVLNDPDRATNLLKDCEKYVNHNRKVYTEYLADLKAVESTIDKDTKE